ncbi:MAG TPA: TRAP transporter small permease subunit, partial [Stellaceae bacterium]|nr:TRAP transporter small permease subunit [Stellaceae bacterium]
MPALLALATEVLVVSALAIDLAVTFANTVGRYAFNTGIDWAADLSIICLAVISFPGAAAYYRRGSGMAYRALVERLPGRARDTAEAVGLWAVIAVAAISLLVFPTFFRLQVAQSLPVLDISNGWVAIWLGVGLALMLLFAIEKLLRLDGRGIGLGFLIAAAVGVLAVALRLHVLGGAFDPMLPIAPMLILAFLAGAPIAIVLALGGILFFLVTGLAPLVVVPAAYQAGIGSFVLLSIPFFMIAGALMDVTGMAARLIDMVEEWIGHWR